jgi:hypothetical protein
MLALSNRIDIAIFPVKLPRVYIENYFCAGDSSRLAVLFVFLPYTYIKHD